MARSLGCIKFCRRYIKIKLEFKKLVRGGGAGTWGSDRPGQPRFWGTPIFKLCEVRHEFFSENNSSKIDFFFWLASLAVPIDLRVPLDLGALLFF